MGDDKADILAFCNTCGRENTHCPVGSFQHKRNDGQGTVVRMQHETWVLLQCQGCRCVKVRFTVDCPGFDVPRVTEYPPMVRRRAPEWQGQLPQEIKDLHKEVYAAMQNRAPRCATMGARALIDMVLTELVGKDGNFGVKLDMAVEKRLLTPQDAEILKPAIDAGHAAAHRGFAPNEEQIEAMLEIVERLMQGFYVLQQISKRLRAGTPPRTIEGRE